MERRPRRPFSARDRDTRILLHHDALLLRGAANRQPHSVRAWHHERPRRGGTGPCVIILTAAAANGQLGVAQIPHHTIDTARARGLEHLHRTPRAVEHGELHRRSRLTHPIVDERAVRGVLAAEDHVARMRAQIRGANLHRRLYREQMRVAGRHCRRELLQRVELIENPEAARMRAQHQRVVACLNRDVVERHQRHVVAQWQPLPTGIGRNEHAELGGEVQQFCIARIFTHRARNPVGRQPRIDPTPRGAEVARGIHIVREVVAAVIVRHHIRRPGRVPRRFHPREPRVLRQSRETALHIGKRGAAIARYTEAAVVGAHVQHALHSRRLGQRRHPGEVRHAVIQRQRVLPRLAPH